MPKKISQVAQIFTKESERKEGRITTTYAVLAYEDGLIQLVFRVNTSLVPRRSLLPRCPREVCERAGERTGVYLSVTSQLTVESRIDRAENA